MDNKINIDEMIADAIAEEEVKNDNKGMFSKFNEVEITIPLKEYLSLKLMSADFDRIMRGIMDSFGLNYNGESLRVNNGESITEVMNVLYPDIMENLYEELKKKEQE